MWANKAFHYFYFSMDAHSKLGVYFDEICKQILLQSNIFDYIIVDVLLVN